MQAHAITMMKFSKTRILLVSRAAGADAKLREVIARGGMEPELIQVSRREEIATQLEAERPALVLADLARGESLRSEEILEVVQRKAPGVAVVLLGGEDEPEGDLDAALAAIRSGATDYLRRSQIDCLPLIVERAVRDYETALINDGLRYEVRHAADLMRESQKLVTVGRLAGSIAHEINNPLESVTNLLFLLGTDEGLSERARDYLKLAQRELDRVAQIARQTLNFYRDSPLPVRIQPAELMEEVLVLYARRIAEKRITVLREFEAERTIQASPGEMRQVFSNLITNAIEATGPGGKLHLRVRGCRRWGAHPGRGMRISIADNGSGMSREIRQRLGEPFFTTKGQRGTGLGLWVTQSIVQRHGGTMQVSSSTDPVQHGTVFSIFLPVTPRPQSVIAINERGSNASASGGSGTRSFGGGSRNGPRQRLEFINGTE